MEKNTYFQIFASINCWGQVTVIDKNLHQHFTHPSTLHCLLFCIHNAASSITADHHRLQSQETLRNIKGAAKHSLLLDGHVCQQAQSWEGRKLFHAPVNPDRSSSTFDSLFHDSSTITLHPINTITLHTSL